MQRMNIVTLAWVIGGFVLLSTAGIQTTTAAEQSFQILSGSYQQVGGIWGVLTQTLPNPGQAFLTLSTNASDGRAELSFLGADQQTVFLKLTNGVSTGSTIRFQYPVRHPYFPNVEDAGTLDYTATNVAGVLRVDGAIRFQEPMGPDIPHFFGHTNVTAAAMPVLETRVSELELRWTGESNRTYQVQYRSDLTTNVWTSLGSPIPGNGSTTSTVDQVNSDEPRRFYRVVVVP